MSPSKGIAAIVLAAGCSKRMGERNKLLQSVNGAPLISRVVGQIMASTIKDVFVVTGFECQQVASALESYPITPLYNPNFSTGIASSIRTGIEKLPDDTSGVMVFLGDMPLITHDLIQELISHFDPAAGRSIIIPTYEGNRGNPVLWSQSLFGEMRVLKGDRGARTLFTHHCDLIHEIPVMTQSILQDIDTPDCLTKIENQLTDHERGGKRSAGSDSGY